MNRFFVSFSFILLVVMCFSGSLSSQILRETNDMAVEPFDTDILVHGTSASESVWFAPDYNSPIAHDPTGGCPGGRIGYSGNWNDYWGNFVRLPSQDFTGSDTISLFFDVSHSYSASQTDNWCRFYIWADGGYQHTVTSILIDGVDETYDSGMNGKGFQFTEERTCAAVEVRFDLSTIADPSSILIYMEAFCNYNNSTPYSVWFDNVSVTGSGGSPTPPEPDLGPDQTICESNTPLTLDAGSYESYIWSTGETTQTVDVNSTDTYSVTVTNTSGLTGSDMVNITVLADPDPVSSAAASPAAVCAGDSETISLTASGGSGNNLQWYSGSCGGTFIGSGSPLDISQPASTTTYYVRWENSCGASACESITVNVSDLPEEPVSADALPAEVCEGGTEAISLSVNGGAGSTLMWYSGSCGGTAISSGNPLSITQPQSNTTYYARWENACGVSACKSITVNVLPSANASISPAGPYCETDLPDLLTAADEGGFWTGAGITDTLTGEFDPGTAGPGNHTITYTISGYCGDSDQITIQVDSLSIPSISINDTTLCEGDDPLSLQANIPGGIWLGNGIVEGSNVFMPETAGAGEHEIIYSLTSACSGSDTISLTVEAKAVANILTDSVQCIPADSIALTAIDTGGNWYFDGSQVFSDYLYAGTGDEGMHQLVYTISGNCGDSDTLVMQYKPYTNPIITPAGPFMESDSPQELQVSEEGGTWHGLGTDSVTGTFNPQAAGEGEHQIIYTIEGKCGGSDTTSVLVHSSSDAELTVATVLTPNGDGYNDRWRIAGISGIQTVDIRIFNRWGDTVFSYTGNGEGYSDPKNQWDGTYKGKDQPMGNYVYVISADNQTFNGSLTLIR
jgi:gliding motility-associated-like protein